MKLKRMLLLASMALAAMAFGAPAAQANLDWSSTGTIDGTGELTSDSETGLVTGGAEVHFKGSVTGGSSTGEITDFEITTGESGIPTNIPNCHAEASTSALPWIVHLKTPDTMTITDVTFTNTYTGSGCAEFGIPHEVEAEGDVTLTVEEDGDGRVRCVDADPYSDFGTLFVEGTNVGVDITGTACWTGPTITGL